MTNVSVLAGTVICTEIAIGAILAWHYKNINVFTISNLFFACLNMMTLVGMMLLDDW